MKHKTANPSQLHYVPTITAERHTKPARKQKMQEMKDQQPPFLFKINK